MKTKKHFTLCKRHTLQNYRLNVTQAHCLLHLLFFKKLGIFQSFFSHQRTFQICVYRVESVYKTVKQANFALFFFPSYLVFPLQNILALLVPCATSPRICMEFMKMFLLNDITNVRARALKTWFDNSSNKVNNYDRGHSVCTGRTR